RGLRTHSWPAFAFAGVASGAAYLTRPEGAVVAAATGLILLFQQLSARCRRPWRRVLTGGVALTAGALVLALPFMLLIGGITTKPSANYIINKTSADDAGAPWLRSQDTRPPAPDPRFRYSG